jgi:hypothetical protein
MSAVHTMTLQDNNNETGYQHAYEIQVDRHVLVNGASHLTAITPRLCLHMLLWEPHTFILGEVYLIGNGSLKRVFITSNVQQRFPWIRAINKEGFRGDKILESSSVCTTADQETKRRTVWGGVTKESSFVNPIQ